MESLVLQDCLRRIQEIGDFMKDKNKTSAEVKYVRISPFKMRKVADTVRHLTPLVALEQLALMPQRSARILYKLIHSALHNAIHNNSLNKSNLLIDELIVNEGPKLKRSKARARGRMFGIMKPYSHAKVILINQGELNGSKS